MLLFSFSQRNNCQNQSTDANLDILSSYKLFNVLRNSLEENAPWMSLFAFVAWRRNIRSWLFSVCTSALYFYFSLLQCFLKNATTQGEHYFETFSWCHWITLLSSSQHSASSKKVTPTDGSAAGRRKQPCFLGNSLLKRKDRWLLLRAKLLYTASVEWPLSCFLGRVVHLQSPRHVQGKCDWEKKLNVGFQNRTE